MERKEWAQGKKPSMKRRCDEHNYTERGIYMITLPIEGRKPLLGTLKTEPKPHIVLSPLGERVGQEWYGIPRYYPQIKVLKLCVMPDHIHGILYVQEKIARHLGHVINGFKTGTRRAAKEIDEAQPHRTEQAEQAKQARQAEQAGQAGQARQAEQASPVAYTEALPQSTRPTRPTRPKHPTIGTLWEPGYNDRILLQKNQLQHWYTYLDDNPRRLAIKRQHPEYFTQIASISAAGLTMPAMGNRFLLDYPYKLQVQCSRHLYPNEIDQQKQAFLEAGRQGAVIVSPCISPGEREIATACMQAGIPLIVLLLKGFSPYFKPQPRYIEACAKGRLLMLAPYPFQNERLTDMRQRCLHLNDLAALICKPIP